MAYDIGKPVPTGPVKKFKIPRRLLDFLGRDITPPIGQEGPVLTDSPVVGKDNWIATKNNIGTAGDSPDKGSGLFGKSFNKNTIDTINKITPFASNIVNSFRKPPMPTRGIPDTYTALQKVDSSDEKFKLTSSVSAANRATERNIDSNTAEAIKKFNQGEEFSRLSTINERDQKVNSQISNVQAQMDIQVAAGNTAKVNKYQDELVARQVAHQREQSANVANAGDKAVMIRNENTKRDTELAKANVLKDLYSRSGVLDRERRRLKAAGEPDPFGKDYKDLDDTPLAYGGMLTKLPKKKIA